MNAVLMEPRALDGLWPLPHPGGLGKAGRRPLRIAMVVPPCFEAPPRAYGGVESVVVDLADTLVRRGHQVTLVCARELRTRAAAVPVWPRPIPEEPGQPLPEITYAGLVRRVVRTLAERRRIDLVHDHTLAGALNASVYQAMGLPTVVTAHGSVDRALRALYRALAEEIHLVAVNNQQRHLAPELNWAGTVHDAVRVDSFPYRADKGAYALFLGRFHPDRAAHLAVAAAHAAGMPLIVAGRRTEPIEQQYFEQEVRPRLNGTDRVLDVADEHTRRRLLAGARCLLSPACPEEPFGVTMIEAMACGTPVVALRRGAVGEVVVDGLTGYIRDEPEELPAVLRRLGDIDPAACRRWVAEYFDVERMGTGYESVYRVVLGGTGTAPAATIGTAFWTADLANRTAEPAGLAFDHDQAELVFDQERARLSAGLDEPLGTPPVGDGHALAKLRREYADLDADLDRRYDHDRRLARRGGSSQHRHRRQDPAPDQSNQAGAA